MALTGGVCVCVEGGGGACKLCTFQEGHEYFFRAIWEQRRKTRPNSLSMPGQDIVSLTQDVKQDDVPG